MNRLFFNDELDDRFVRFVPVPHGTLFLEHNGKRYLYVRRTYLTSKGEVYYIYVHGHAFPFLPESVFLEHVKDYSL